MRTAKLFTFDFKYTNIKTQYTEEELLNLLRAGSENGFHHLYDNYSAALYGVILRIVPSRDSAEDLMQEIFVKIWNSIDQYDPAKGRFYTWMLTIARHCAIDHLKSKSFQNDLKNRNLSDFVYTETQLSTTTAEADFGLKNILKRLDEDKQKMIDLAYYQGFTQTEIAEKMKMPLGTVKTKLRSALQKLRDVLKEK